MSLFCPQDGGSTIHTSWRYELDTAIRHSPRTTFNSALQITWYLVVAILSSAFPCNQIKQSLLRPGQVLRVPGDSDSQISRHSTHEGDKFVSPTHQPSLLPNKYSCYSFLLDAESIPGPQCDRKDYANKKFQLHHRESYPRPPGLQCSASNNCTTACPAFGSTASLNGATVRCVNKIFCIIKTWMLVVKHN